LKVAPPEETRQELRRIRLDTYVGMTFSNVISYFMILTAAVTLHANGVTDIQTAQQAARTR
jgi:Mn2+/Fe2+ NRAMP family transporter